MMTLKILSRSPKFYQLFPFSQHCIYASLVKLHPLIQKIMQGNPILDISKGGVTLKIRSRSPQFDLLFPYFQQCIYACLVEIHLHVLIQKIKHGNPISYIQSADVTLKIKSRSLKFNLTFPSAQQCIYASMVKIQSLV